MWREDLSIKSNTSGGETQGKRKSWNSLRYEANTYHPRAQMTDYQLRFHNHHFVLHFPFRPYHNTTPISTSSLTDLSSVMLCNVTSDETWLLHHHIDWMTQHGFCRGDASTAPQTDTSEAPLPPSSAEHHASPREDRCGHSFLQWTSILPITILSQLFIHLAFLQNAPSHHMHAICL
ncbi:hypothetical protein ECG_03211 [Echinococcus granulosus]|nr:hypothetical protein ECG_03211 [Echinococcus granulosus]